MKRIAYTTAPHPITGRDAFLEIFDFGQDSVMRCRLTEIDGTDAIIYAGTHPEAVMRQTGLFWHLDAERDGIPVEIPAIAWAKTPGGGDWRGTGTVTVYDDGTGRALLQRISDDEQALSVTWKSPEYAPIEWMSVNGELDWHPIGPTRPDSAPPAAVSRPEPIVDDEGFVADANHVHFKASKLSIGWAVTYQDAPRKKGSTDAGGVLKVKSSMRFPLLVAGDYVDDAEEVCKAAAAILERNKAEMGAK